MLLASLPWKGTSYWSPMCWSDSALDLYDGACSSLDSISDAAYLLDLTSPCPIAVQVGPFSTSVFQSSHLNIGYYHSASPHELHNSPHTLLLTNTKHLRWWWIISGLLQRHPFSGLVHLAGELLHTYSLADSYLHGHRLAVYAIWTNTFSGI